MKINAAARLKATIEYDDYINRMKALLDIDGKLVDKHDQYLTFELRPRYFPLYIMELDRKTKQKHRKGRSPNDTIYRWKIANKFGSLGFALYLPHDDSKPARFEVYNTDETKAAVIKAYDSQWADKATKDTQRKYQGQQKPAILEDGVFKMQPSALASALKNLYKDDYQAASGAITLYMNRAGKKLLSTDRSRLEKARNELRKIYGKEENE